MMNEHYQPLNEDMRFEALSQLREIQSNLVGISFLPVIAIMRPENPLKSDVLKFQDDLDELTMAIQQFISSAKNDLDYKPAEDEAGEEEGEEAPEEEAPAEDEEKEEKPKDKKKPEDSSEPKE